MYEVICKYCGAKKVYPHHGRYPTTFCNKECSDAYDAKVRRERRAAAREKRNVSSQSQTPVPLERCQKCKYGSKIGCNYMLETGKSRVAMHLGEKHPKILPADCKEFEPRPRQRRNKLGTVCK
jgi:hypothetical protein